MLRTSVAVLLLVGALPAWAAEPIIGTWKMTKQEVNGQAVQGDALILRVRDLNNQVEFAYSTPINDVYFVGTKFTVKLDGSPGDVTDSKGNKVGAVKISKSGNSAYKITLTGANRPAATGTMTVSADGKTLVSESDATVPGKGNNHARQEFTRY